MLNYIFLVEIFYKSKLKIYKGFWACSWVLLESLWWVGFNQEDFKKIRFKIWNLEKEKKKVLEGKK